MSANNKSDSGNKPKKDIHAGKDPKEKEKKRLAIKDRKFEHSDIAKEGQISVPRRFGRWNKRWMIAKNDGQVFFFKSSNCKQMTSDYFDLKEVGLIKTLKKEKGHDFAFKVKLSDEIWIGAAESEDERRSWISILQTLRDKVKGKKPLFAAHPGVAYQQQQYAQYYQQQQYAQYYQQYYAQGNNTTSSAPTTTTTATATATATATTPAPATTATGTSVAVRDAAAVSPSSPTTIPTPSSSATQDPAAQLQQMQQQMQNLQQYQQYLQYQQYAQQYPQQYTQAYYAQQYPQYAQQYQQYAAQTQSQQSYPSPTQK